MGTLSAWSENLSTKKKKKVIKQLVEGQDYANQLQILLHNNNNNPSQQQQTEHHLSSSKEQLVDKILSSFNQTLAALTSVNVSSSHNQTGSNDDQLVKSEDCSESRRPRPKDKRGCYKRKYTLVSFVDVFKCWVAISCMDCNGNGAYCRRAEQAWTVVSATTQDGHGWRKYGQKGILNSKHPRSYFRCTRKYDQGCRATKQVQRLEDDDGSQMYRTTYIGTHTCTNRSFKAPRIISNSESRGTCIAPIEQHDDRRSNLAPTTPVVKGETKEEMFGTSSDVTDLDSAMWKDFMEFEYYSEPDVMISNVYSCTGIKFRNFEMDFVNVFEFDGSDECVL
ncbi:putative WRKY transcription factor 54 [Gossypium australe]|uniref:Putative WRKY transcription factor 54 n=1 Tax=Gossypium australe TaxID=47621 RepID=A0A5B6U8C9_9ROSI|nr:putative WRKY transcription factor 54 [Gossypium australe]